jgi:hypothetical protein
MKNTAHTVVDPSKSQERCNGVAPNLFESNILKRFAEISLSNNISGALGAEKNHLHAFEAGTCIFMFHRMCYCT